MDEYKRKRRKKKPTLLMRWWMRGLADVLCVDMLVCRCGWWWMLVVDVHECKKKKKLT